MTDDKDDILAGPAADIRHESARRTRRSFLVGGATAAAAAWAAYAIQHSKDAGRLQAGLRRTLDIDASINRAVFHERGLAPTYPVSRAVPLRLNGAVGMDQTLDLASWRLQLVGTRNPQASRFFSKDVGAWDYKYLGDMPESSEAADVKSAPGNGTHSKTGDDSDDDKADDKKSGPDAQQPAPPTQKPNTLNPTGATDSDAAVSVTEKFRVLAESMQKKRKEGDAEAGPSYSSLDLNTPGLLLSMDDLAAQLTPIELVTEFKCVEGWSNITHWAGFRLRDLLDLYPPQQINGRDPRYVYMETPDGNYYGGYDLAAARHPQSLLVTHMHGAPLTQDHGAPLRLHMPIKYGYKQLKRIGLIAYTDLKPDDYWTKLGYDWYAGL